MQVQNSKIYERTLKLLKNYCELFSSNPIMEQLYKALWEVENRNQRQIYGNIISILEKQGYIKRFNGKILDKPIIGIGLTQKGLEYLLF